MTIDHGQDWGLISSRMFSLQMNEKVSGKNFICPESRVLSHMEFAPKAWKEGVTKVCIEGQWPSKNFASFETTDVLHG